MPGSLYWCELSLGCSCFCLLLTPQFLARYLCISMKPPPFRDEMPSCVGLLTTWSCQHRPIIQGIRWVLQTGRILVTTTIARLMLEPRSWLRDQYLTRELVHISQAPPSEPTHVQISFLSPQPVPSRCARYYGVSTV